MGQRLVVQIFDGEKRLANCYYHWSGYTFSSAEITDNIINNYKDSLKEKKFFEDRNKDMTMKAIKMLVATGAGLPEHEMKLAEQLFGGIFEFGLKYAEDRNEGIIGISEEEMESSLSWSEATVNIDIASETVDFQAYFVESYKDWFDNQAYNMIEENYDLDYLEDEEKEKIINKDIEKVNKYFEEGFISEYNKGYLLEELKNGNSVFVEPEIQNVDCDIDLNCIPFAEFYRAIDLFGRQYGEQEYEFILNGNKDKVICMIQ